MEAILSAPSRRVDAFLAAGHVCTVMGLDEYRPLAARYRVPIVATGFEPLDLLQGIHMCVQPARRGPRGGGEPVRAGGAPGGERAGPRRHPRGVRGRPPAWRGIGFDCGERPGAARTLRRAGRRAALRRQAVGGRESPECRSGEVLQGLLKPTECPAFGTRCTPERPLGATMVSSEGTCAAYFRYRRTRPGRRERRRRAPPGPSP